MKCKNCGNEIKDGANFCIFCGNPVKENVKANESNLNNEVSSQPKRKLYYDDNEPRIMFNSDNVERIKAIVKKKRRSAVGAIVFYVLLLVVIKIFTSYYLDFKDSWYKEDIIFGRDRIATIYGALNDKQKICLYNSKFSGLSGEITVEYCDDVFDIETLKEYEEYLVEKEGFRLDKDSKVKVFKKNSLDGSYELTISIDYDNSTIIYEKIPKTENNDVNDEDNVSNLEA